MLRRQPSATRTDTLFPYPPLVRSHHVPESRPGAPGAAWRPQRRPPSTDDVMARRTPSARPGDGVRRFVRSRSVRAPTRLLNRSEEHTSELQSLMRISYAVFCLKKKNIYIVIIAAVILHSI